MAKMSISNPIYNDYERARQKFESQGSFYYSPDEWIKEARHGRLDMYINAINKMATADDEKFIADYSIDKANADKDAVTKALYNEAFSNRTDTKKRKVPAVGSDGNFVVDDSGNQILKEVEMTDYDYYKQQLSIANRAAYNVSLNKSKSNSDSGIVKFGKYLGTIPAFASELGAGAVHQINSVIAQLKGLSDAAYIYLRTGKKDLAADARLQGTVNGRVEEFDQLEQELINFESRYSYMRDEDGNYTVTGEWIGQLARTLGQMIPAALTGKAIGNVVGAVAGANAGAGIAGASSQLVFYAGLDADQIKETYNKFAERGYSISSAQILANADIKATMQLMVEVGLAKALGASQLDKMVFGRTSQAATGFGKSALTQSAYNRILHDFIEEGLEEVFQDTSDYLVDHVFMQLIDQNYGELTDLTWDGLITSFIMGGLASLVGASVNILKTNNIPLNIIETDKNGNIITDKKGNPKLTNLAKLQSWEYGLDMESAVRNFNIIIESARNNNLTSKQRDAYSAAVMQAYAAVRMMQSIYDEVGESRFAGTNAILTKITNGIADGDYDTDNIRKNVIKLVESFNSDDRAFNEAATKKLNDAKAILLKNKETAENISEQIKALETATNSKVDLVESIDKTVELDDLKKERHVVTSVNIVKNQPLNIILEDIAEQKIVETISNNLPEYGIKGKNFEILQKIYLKYSHGVGEADVKTVVTSLLFDKNFLNTVLFDGNINLRIFEFIAKLDNITRTIMSDKTLGDLVYNKRIRDILSNLRQKLVKFFKIMPDIPYETFNIKFTKDQITEIKNGRIEGTIFKKVYDAKVTDAELDRALELYRAKFNLIKDGDGLVTVNDESYFHGTIDEALNKIRLYVKIAKNNIAKGEKKSYRNPYSFFVCAAARDTNLIFSYYDGIHYPQAQSITNRNFINYLEDMGMYMYEFFTNELTDEEIDYYKTRTNIDIKDRSDAKSIAEVRSYIYKTSIPNNNIVNDKYKYDYELQYNFVDDVVDLMSVYVLSNLGGADTNPLLYKSNIAASSFDVAQTEQRIEKGITTKLGTDGIDTLFSDNIPSHIRTTLTIDDLLINPSIINDDIKSKIPGWGFASNANERAYLLNMYITENYENLVIGQDIHGKYVLIETSDFNAIKGRNFISLMSTGVTNAMNGIETEYTLSQIIPRKYIVVGKENFPVKFINNKNGTAAAYTTTEGIFINVANFRNFNQLTEDFKHEYDHISQEAALLSSGFSPDSVFSVSNLDELFEDVEKFMPGLVPDRFIYNDTAKWRHEFAVNIYRALIGELYANNTYKNNVFGMGVFSIVNDQGMVAILTPWGKLYTTSIATADVYSLADDSDAEGNRFFFSEQLSQLNKGHDAKLVHNTITSGRFVKLQDSFGVKDAIYQVISQTDTQSVIRNVETKQEVIVPNTSIVETCKRGIIDNVANDRKVAIVKLQRPREKWLRYLYDNLGGEKQFAYGEFLDTYIPVMYCVTDRSIALSEDQNNKYVGAYIGFLDSRTFSNITYAKIANNENGEVVIGLIKPTDIEVYAPDSSYNCYIKASNLEDTAKTYPLYRKQNTLSIYNGNKTVTNKTQPVTLADNKGELPTDMYNELYPRYSYLEKQQTGGKGRGKIRAIEYEYGGASDPYARKTRITFEDNSSLLTDYKYKEGYYKGTKITAAGGAGTNLQYFDKRTMSPQLQKFIVNATGDNKVAPELQDKIDGKNAGTLTYSDVANYLRDTSVNSFDKNTFNLINESFYNNEYIKDIETLDMMSDLNTMVYAIGETFKRKDLADFLNSKWNKDTIKKVEAMLRKDPERRQMYDRKFKFYDDKIDSKIDRRRIRDLWLQYFDGTIKSAYDIARRAYVAVSREWKSTDVDIARRQKLISGDKSYTEGGDSLFSNMADADAKDLLDIIISAESADKVNFVATMMIVEKLVQLEKAGKPFVGDVLGLIDRAKAIVSDYEDSALDKAYDKYVKLRDSDPEFRSMIAKYTAATINNDASIINNTSINSVIQKADRSDYNIVQNIKAHAKNIAAAAKANPQIYEDNKDIVNADGTFKKEMYQNIQENGKITYKSTAELLAVEDRLRATARDIRMQQYTKAKNDEYRRRASEIIDSELVKSSEYESDTFSETINDTTLLFKGIRKEMPSSLRRFTYDQFKNKAQSKTRLSSEMDEARQVMSANEFFENNASFLNNMTDGEALDVARYFSDIKVVVLGDMSEMFNAAQVYLSYYVLKNSEGRNPRFEIDKDLREKLRLNIVDVLRRAGQDLAFIKQVYDKITPQRSVIKALVRNYGFEVGEDAITTLDNAVKDGNIDTIQTAKKALFEEMRSSYLGIPHKAFNAINKINTAIKNNNRAEMLDARNELISALSDNYKSEETLKTNVNNYIKAVATGVQSEIDKSLKKLYKGVLTYKTNRAGGFLNRLYEFERAAMLSGPGTWVRNQASDVILRGSNWACEKIGNFVVELIYKVFPNKRAKVATMLDDRYRNFATIKVSDGVKTWIDTAIFKSKYYELIKDGITKYTDKRKNNYNGKIQPMTKLIVDSVISEVYGEAVTDSKILQRAYGFVNKMIGDNYYIDKTFKKYLGKIIMAENIDISAGVNSPEMMNAIAKAYSFAASDYMHKGNLINSFESWISDKLGPRGYFIWKQVCPFLSASVNWFLEGIKGTPIGLINSIVKFARLENTIEKAMKDYNEGKTAIDPRFTEYLLKRDIGKGLVGTVAFVIGILLAVFKRAKIDEKDDKIKLHIGETLVDITALFGTQGILQGIAFISAIETAKKEYDNNFDKLIDVTTGIIKAVFDQMFADTTISDMYTTLRYSNGVADALVNKLMSVPSMFIPNLIKSVSVFNKYKVKYESGIAGRMEKLLVQAMPTISYALPHSIDPYTGEDKILYKFWGLAQVVNKMTPINLAPYNVSDIEKKALEVGVNKGELSGAYRVGDDKITLSKAQIEATNKLYGKLNNEDLDKFINNKKSYSVKRWNKTKKAYEYVELRYSKMTDDERANVIERIMNNNASIAKVYALTTYAGYKYYATSQEEFKELRKSGVAHNVFIKMGKAEGFKKIN